MKTVALGSLGVTGQIPGAWSPLFFWSVHLWGLVLLSTWLVNKSPAGPRLSFMWSVQTSPLKNVIQGFFFFHFRETPCGWDVSSLNLGYSQAFLFYQFLWIRHITLSQFWAQNSIYILEHHEKNILVHSSWCLYLCWYGEISLILSRILTKGWLLGRANPDNLENILGVQALWQRWVCLGLTLQGWEGQLG